MLCSLLAILPIDALAPIESGRPVKLLAFLKIFGPDGFGTETLDKLPCTPNSRLVIRKDRRLV